MEMQTYWSDRGGAMELEPACSSGEIPALLVVSRGGSLAVTAAVATVWLVLRGRAELECREGRFALERGQWLSLERGTRPALCAGSDALVVGIALTERMQAQPLTGTPVTLYPGLGRCGRGTRGAALELLRRCAPFARNEVRRVPVERHPFGQLLRLFAAQQAYCRDLVDRCPGRSQRRKRQVFMRMQRAWLYLAGHLERGVRIPELAAMSNVSVWYFTKTFHALYGEGPQATSARMRLAHAAELLRKTRMSVSEVGEACGFENNCSFSRAFRAQFGTPPSLHRLNGERVSTEPANATGSRRQAATGTAA